MLYQDVVSHIRDVCYREFACNYQRLDYKVTDKNRDRIVHDLSLVSAIVKRVAELHVATNFTQIKSR